MARSYFFTLPKVNTIVRKDTSGPVAYAFTARTSPNAQPIEVVSTIRDLGLFLDTGFLCR